MKFWPDWSKKKGNILKNNNFKPDPLIDPYKLEPTQEEIEKTIMTANYSIFTMRVTNSDHIIDTVFLSHN